MTRRPGTKHHRSRTGCYTCRQRKKRCDEQFNATGSCRTCARLELECHLPRSRNPVALNVTNNDDIMDGSIGRGDTPSEGEIRPLEPDVGDTVEGEVLHQRADLTAENSSPIQSVLVDCLTPRRNQTSEEQFELIHYFTNYLIPRRVIIPVEHSGLYMLIPRAFEQPEVMAALMASSTAHQMQYIPETTRNGHFQHKAQSQYSKALGTFSQYLQNDQHDWERAATCAILLILTDIVQGGTEEWYHHLLGGIAIVNRARDSIDPQNIVYHRFITRFLIYHDVLAAVAMQTSTALDWSFYEQERQQLVSENLHSLAGANSLILTLLARICRLKNLASEDPSENLFLIYSEANMIEKELSLVKCGATCSLFFDICLETYRSSALLLLYRTIESCETSECMIRALRSKSESCCQDLMDYLLRISVDTTLSPALVFPLFIAGISATSKDQQLFIRDRIQSIYSQLFFGNIINVGRILEEFWNRDTQHETMTWGTLLSRRNWRLALA